MLTLLHTFDQSSSSSSSSSSAPPPVFKLRSDFRIKGKEPAVDLTSPEAGGSGEGGDGEDKEPSDASSPSKKKAKTAPSKPVSAFELAHYVSIRSRSNKIVSSIINPPANASISQ